MLNVNTYRELKKKVKIDENNEEMVKLPETFETFKPHLYQKLGAPYQDKSPFYIRETVLNKLIEAEKKLYKLEKFKFKIFDIYRPIQVQKFMIEYDTNKYGKEIAETYWSPILKDVSLSPPPHSTGGALDLTIIDENGNELNMGTKIDELSEKSHFDFFKLDDDKEVFENRKLLNDIMVSVGFTQLPTEWWHFSYGDQIWGVDNNCSALYGMI